MSCNCYKNPCTCFAATPEPYYLTGVMCKEDHCQVIQQPQYSLGIQITSAWNVPTCFGSAVISIPGLYGASPGSYIWNKSYGYFEIIAVDTDRQFITIQNPCWTDNASPGTAVPKCTNFIVTAPPCCDDVATTGNCVKIDFTAPEIGDCIDIIVTGTEGLLSGNNIQIGSATYLLNEIKPNNILNICNQGEGAIPGTPVLGLDEFGRCQNRVILLSRNTCADTAVSSGSVVVCNTGTTRVLDVPNTGKSVLIGHVGTTNEAKFTNPACGLIIGSDDRLAVDPSGIWGQGATNYPGNDLSGAPIYCASDNKLRTIPKYLPSTQRLAVSTGTIVNALPGGGFIDSPWSTVVTIGPPQGRNYTVSIVGFAQANLAIRPDTANPAAGVIGVAIELDIISPAPSTTSNLNEQYVYQQNSAGDPLGWQPYNLEASINRSFNFTNTETFAFRIRARYRSTTAILGGGLRYGNGPTIAANAIITAIGID